MKRLAPLAALSLAGCSLVMGSGGGLPALEADRGPAGSIAVGAKYAGWLLSAPLVLAATPIAALLWATPWVDLAQAVDVAGAPMIGLGWTCEALVGGPARALLFWAEPAAREAPLGPVTAPRRPPRGPAPWGLPLARWAVRTPPRPARPLSPDDAARYAVQPDDVAALTSALAGMPWGETVSAPLSKAPFAARLEVTLAGPARAPLVLLTPPVEALFAARWMAARFARRGVHAAVVVPDEEFLVPALAPEQVEPRLRAAVVAARVAVAGLAARPEVDPSRLRYLGVSAGGIFGALLVAVEPRVGRAALLLPGGDLPTLFAESQEPGVVAWREGWADRGVSAAELRRRLAATLVTDPVRLAAHVDPRAVLLVLGRDDTLVPIASGLLLHDALGEPETWIVAGDHETASLAFGFLLREADRFLGLEEPRATAATPTR